MVAKSSSPSNGFSSSMARINFGKIFQWLKKKLPHSLYLLIASLAFVAVWLIFVVTSSASFNAGSILFGTIRNGELLDLNFQVFIFDINAVEALSSLFGVIFEFGSLGLDFVLSTMSRAFLRTTVARNISKEQRKAIQEYLSRKMFVSQLRLLFVAFGYAILQFTVLSSFLSSDMNPDSAPTSFIGGQVDIPPVLHLPSDIWELIALALLSFALMAGSMFIIPQLIVATTEVFIVDVLNHDFKDKLIDEITETFYHIKNNIDELKDDDFFK